ncbi:hypothetical protein PCANC_03686 [Puccinia coronata f. sp. avenae]|uniref:Pheromone-processing carboxypeptidase KEX1 n=1 Tax=Puccinia coronata f. sp. avenae TaxID=200324 RepID=A0A2N5SE56_9BASI|nr:hypothetical protein PCASD_20717 [Puccinia coronata f. sp. avenae]PLW54744.1 hypothetical protein PCANC_03686 [Puccinia coronata f. sp. avenae]
MAVSGSTNEDSSSDLPSSASFLVDALPGQPASTVQSIIQYAGHLPSHPPSTLTPPPDSHLWFWLVRSRHIAKREKFVIWFNGGPGCSSAEGALFEVGPFTLRPNPAPGQPLELIESAIGWSEYANLLFIDQPAGTGFSFVNNGDPVRELAEAAEQVVVFLKNFYQVFPEFSKIDTYLAGESFAGQYIPYFAQAIFDTAALSTPLMGLMMGNPWLDPKVQYLSYLDFAYERGMIVKGTSSATEAEKSFQKCESALKKPAESKQIIVQSCENALQAILDAGAQVINGTKMTPVPYNITEMSDLPSIEWPKRNKNLQAYLVRNSTVIALHATSKMGKWTLCNDTVGVEMQVPKSAPSSTLLAGLLKKLKVLIYVGDQDFMCNSLGLNRSLSGLEWNAQTGFGVDDHDLPILPQDYYVNGTKQGSWTEARGLTFVKFDHASHLVPVDVPHAAHDMLLRFLEVDPLLAAGPVSSVSSQVGAEEHAGIVVKTHANGTVIGQEKLQTEHDQSGTRLGAAPVLETVEEREAYYGPRQTVALIIVLTCLILGLVMLFQWRRKRRRRRHGPRHFAANKLKGRAIYNMHSQPHSPHHSRPELLRRSPSPATSRNPYNRVRKRDEEEAQTLVAPEQASSLDALSLSRRTSSFLSEIPSNIQSHSQIFSLEDEDDDDNNDDNNNEDQRLEMK